MLMNESPSNKSPSEESRWQTLEDFRDWAEVPLIFLAFIWLVLLVVELIWGLTPLITAFGTSIWIVFIIEFGISLSLAPKKLTYIRRNWLTVIALVVPALRILRFARVVRLLRVSRAIRGMRLIKVVGSLNRAMQALRSSMSRRGLGYMGVLSCIVILVGAAGMYAFEGGRQEAEGFQSYGDALWWTAMIITTLGSEFWPRTFEGRVLGFLLSLFAFGVFGYFTAVLASFFIGHDAEVERRTKAGTINSIESLRREIEALKEELREERNSGK
jgi:voltage-gated potassium channel